MDERRLYAILAAGGALLLAVALVDVATDDGDPAPTSVSAASSTTATKLGPTTTTPASADNGPDKEADDRLTQAEVRNALVVMKVVRADTGAYSADLAALNPVDPTLQLARGIATGAAALNLVFVDVGGNGQVACASARSPSGELFMVKDVAQGAAPGLWYARGALLPTTCDDQPLSTAW